ncbi:MAG: LacI family DNA-binding transcriptional regulator [Spirochaetia bacterium]|nr:LacI family DNA-binding transcriptional regulator [Spirochaetia bacterium]MCF7946765.1 LacI family DNA-binding transcriptional regulator [Spirochaetia bacterium]MCF7953355.1 LacI family DNA-binding transcriptional regulator [Spirochaetales bacterium]
MKRISSKDVAREAGVSQSTVSRVFNNNSGIPVSQKKIDIVLEAAERLGYRPSLIARSLNQQFTNIIGIVIRNFSNQFYIESLRYFSELFQKKGYTIMLFNIQQEGEIENDLLRALEYEVDGIIITSATLTSPLVKKFQNYDTPVFLFNRLSDGESVNSVCCDNVAGGEKIAEYLIQTGHRNMVYICGDRTTSTNRDRENGFLGKAAELGFQKLPVYEGDFSYKSGYEAAERLISSGESFDAVFCASDYMGIGFMDYINAETNLSIPDDFSLVGFDGIPLQNEKIYPLTTYKQPLKRMVEKTVQLMLKKIENFSSEPMSYLFNGEILERGTVKNRNS